MGFLPPLLDIENLSFIHFSKSLNLLWPLTQGSQWQTLVSTENRSTPSNESSSNPGLPQGWKTMWGISFGIAIICIVPSPSQFLLIPKKCRDALSVGTGPQRGSPQFSRLKSTQSTLYRSPNPPQRGSCTKCREPPAQPYPCPAQRAQPPLVCLQWLPLLRYSPLSSPRRGSNILSFNEPKFSESKDETGIPLWMPRNFSSWPITPKPLS